MVASVAFVIEVLEVIALHVGEVIISGLIGIFGGFALVIIDDVAVFGLAIFGVDGVGVVVALFARACAFSFTFAFTFARALSRSFAGSFARALARTFSRSFAGAFSGFAGSFARTFSRFA